MCFWRYRWGKGVKFWTKWWYVIYKQPLWQLLEEGLDHLYPRHCVNGPDTERNSRGRRIKKEKRLEGLALPNCFQEGGREGVHVLNDDSAKEFCQNDFNLERCIEMTIISTKLCNCLITRKDELTRNTTQKEEDVLVALILRFLKD